MWNFSTVVFNFGGFCKFLGRLLKILMAGYSAADHDLIDLDYSLGIRVSSSSLFAGGKKSNTLTMCLNTMCLNRLSE